MNDVDIGNRIKHYRKGKMTQQELALKINRTESSIRKYEKGLVTIPLDILEEIASALGVSAFDLMGYEYFDRKNPNVGKQVAELQAFEVYLQSLGYSVSENQTAGNVDEGATAVEYPIHGKDIEVTLSSQQYARLQSSSADLIRSFLWSVQQQNQK